MKVTPVTVVPMPWSSGTSWALWKIAAQYYGDGSLYTKIFEANKDTVKNPDLIKVGQRLRIP